MASLDDLITSKVRIKLLKLFFANPNSKYHVRGIVRELGEEINAIRRELRRMKEFGIIIREERGNRVYYFANEEYVMFGDLVSIIAKETALGKAIIDNRLKLSKPAFIMFSGKFTRHKQKKRDDEVDVLVVGEIVLPELATLIREEESKRNQEINYTVMSREEFDFRKKRRDPFILGILAESRVMIIGDEEGLVG